MMTMQMLLLLLMMMMMILMLNAYVTLYAYVQCMKASVSRAAFDCRSVTVAKVSADQRFIAYGTVRGENYLFNLPVLMSLHCM